jgi:alkylation response protein AidB-like acyl-CoA dehydrogenase
VDFRLGPDEQQFRMEVRGFIAEHCPPELRGFHEIHAEHVHLEMAVLRKMAAKGWLGAAFPREYGGLGGERAPMVEYILIDELHHADFEGIALTITYIIGIIGNTLLQVGSAELKREFLPRMLQAELRFAIAYSEPDSGNDVASIRTQAVDDGDDFLISGQKRFITCADSSDYMWTLVRSERGSVRHKGLSIVLMKSKLPGITIQVFEMMNGIQTCEVYLDAVRVPKRYLVGERGHGWRYLMEALSRERMTMINFKAVSEPFERLVQWARSAAIDGRRVGDDPVVRQSLANMHVKIAGGKMMQLVAGARAARKDYVPTLEASACKMYRAMLSWEKANLALDIMRCHGLLTEGTQDAPLEGWWAAEYGWAGHELSGGGGMDLNRKIIAQQGLGLPRWSNS